MTNFFLLTKTLLKTSLFSQFSFKKKDKKGKNNFGKILLMFVFVFLILSSIVLPLIFSVAHVVKLVDGLDNLIVSFIIPIAGLSVILFSVFSMISVFYLNKNSEHLLPLPIESKDLLMAKFFIAIINNYFLLLLFIAPALIGIGIGAGAGILFYIYSFLIFIMLPIIPSVIMCFLIMAIMSVFNISKYKDKFIYISTAFSLLLALGYSFASKLIFNTGLGIDESIESIKIKMEPYLKRLFPFFNSAVVTLNNYSSKIGFFSFITFIGINIIFLIVLYFLGDKLYLKGLTKSFGSQSNKKKNIKVYKETKKNNVFGMLIKKDWLMIKRTPMFMLNLVIVIFITPVILILSLFLSFGGIDEISLLVSNGNVFNNLNIYFILLIVFIFFAAISAVSASAISREGRSAWFMKAIPVSFLKQINAKVFLGIIIDFCGFIFLSIVPIILFKPPFLYVISLMLPLLLIVIIQNYGSILIDLKRPLLSWENENEAVKQNVNVLFSMLLSVCICGIIGLSMVLINLFKLSLSVYVYGGILNLVLALVLLVLISYIKKNQNKLLDKIS